MNFLNNKYKKKKAFLKNYKNKILFFNKKINKIKNIYNNNIYSNKFYKIK